MVNEIKYSISKQHHCKRIITQIFVATIIFLSGVITGAGGTVILLKSRGILRPQRPPRPPRMMASDIAKEIGAEYGLTDEQIEQVEQVFEKAGQSLETMRQDFNERMETGKQEIITGMKAILSPDKFEKWQEDFNARHDRRRGPGPGPNPGEFRQEPPDRH